MFKNLMSKVEEAKKITASVGEQISQQVGDHIKNLNEGTTEGGGITRRFKNAMGVSGESKDLSPSKAENLDSIPEADLLGLEVPRRERRWSGDSNMSVESSVSALFQSVPGMVGTTLDTLDSDQESVVEDTGSSLIKSASKEQISTVLSKLQGRAANYKDKYRDLIKQYNTLVAENNKCRTVLAQTQDKALTRIEKLRNDKKVLAEKLRETHERMNQEGSPTKHAKMEELLEKCKAEISKNRTQIKDLTEENEQLKTSTISSDGSSDSAEALKKSTKEWEEKMNEAESNHAIQLATTKAEMHGALENKDREIESWRAKCRTLEIQDGHANERWQKKVDELQVVVKALEAEKTDMVEKLSTAKQQGVQAVREEEQQKRSDLAEEFDAKEKDLREELDRKIQALNKEHEALIERMQNEFNSQLDKSVVDTEEAEKQDELVSQLRENIVDLESKLAEKDNDMKASLDHSTQRQREEVAALISEHEEIINQTRHQSEVERSAAVSKWEHAQSEIDHLRKKVDSLQKELDQQGQDKNEESFKKEKNLNQRIAELQESLTTLQLNSTIEKEELISNNNKERRTLDADVLNLQQELEKKTTELQDLEEKVQIQQREADVRINELTAMLDEKSEALRSSEAEKIEIQRDLEAARELSAIHEHLREELEEAKKQRDSVEVKVLELIERAEKAEQALEEDKKRLAAEKLELEESFTKSNNTSLEATDLVSFDEPEKYTSQEYEALEQKNNELLTINQALKEEIEQIRNARDLLEDEIAKLGEKYTAEKEEVHRSLTLQLEENKATLQQTSDDLEKKTDAVNVLTTSNDSLNKRVSELEANEQLRESLEAEVLKLKEDNQQLSVTKEEFSSRASSAEERIAQLQAELDSFKSSLTGIEAVEKRLTDDLQKKQQIIDDQNADIQKKESELKTLEDEWKSQITKMEEIETKYKQLSEEKDAELSKVKDELSSLQQEMDTNKHNNDELASKIEELENLNERLRLEFITKEKIIADLRKNVDEVREETVNKQSGYEAKIAEIQQLLNSELESKKDLLTAMEIKATEIESLNKMLQEKEGSQKQVLEEEQKLREQYASALENVKEQLEEATKEIASLSVLKSEKESLEKEITQLAEEHAKTQAEREEKWKVDIEENEQKWESKINKMKQNSEKDVTAAKAELMLEIDGLRASASEKDRKLADSSLEISRLEQQMISLSTVKEELDEKKEKEKKATTKLNDQEHKIIELEADNKFLSDRKNELEEQRESLNGKVTDFEAKIKELETKVQELEELNAEGMRKAAAKQDSDSKKVIRELQKEVKQLYMELNEKTEAFDKLRAEKEVANSDTAVLKHVNTQQKSVEKDYMYEEELENMRKRLNDSHKEIDLLRERNEMLQRNVDSNNKSSSPAMISVNGDKRSMGYEELGFAHSAEAEYLKNVLYRYMAERETLGKECVTLARVIGTVAKFDKHQLDVVLSKEESRVATWVEGTVYQVSHALGGAR
ncbi:unnamed protein product [Auanema sp. JU1783]|nr:unnamed protein product [Auanema sp. JU1783]